jgi:3'-5' exoribonuclease
MPRSKLPLVRLRDLVPGQAGDFFALLAERIKGATRDGKPFFTCRFRDALRTATFMAWADGGWFEACEKTWKDGQCFKIRGQYQEHPTYGSQIDIHNIRLVNDGDRAAGFDPLDLVDCSRFDRDAMFAELKTLVDEHIGDVALRRLALTLLDRHAEAFKRLPATRRHFFPFYGGLLEHTLSVTHACLQLVEKYTAHYPDLRPPLNCDLVVTAAVLHDLGRVLEYDRDPDAAAAQPTVPGQLLGHLFLGRDLVRDTARELGDVDPELLLLLEHLIVSHLNLPEWGSPRWTTGTLTVALAA